MSVLTLIDIIVIMGMFRLIIVQYGNDLLGGDLTTREGGRKILEASQTWKEEGRKFWTFPEGGGEKL